MPGYPLPMMYYPPSGLPGALNLSTCVGNGDGTIVRTNSNPPTLVAYDSDGTEAWCNGTAASTAIGFTLATPYLLPGGTDTVGNGNSISASTAVESSWKWSQDGLFLYNGTTARTRALATPFLLSSASVFSVNAAMNNNRGSTITGDGLRVYLSTPSPEKIARWNLSVPWDLTTAVEDVANVVLLGVVANGVAISNDESRIYVATNAGGKVREYIMSTPGDLTTIPTSLGLAVPNYELTVTAAGLLDGPACLYIAYDMSHMLVGGSTTTPSNRCGFYSLTGSPA